MAVLPKYYKIHTDGCTVELEPIYVDLVTEKQWIPVTERLPETDGFYLVADDIGIWMRYFYANDPVVFENRGKTTHWMPLPAPPTNEKKG